MTHFKKTQNGQDLYFISNPPKQPEIKNYLDLTEEERKIRRHFNTEERQALYIVAGGKCQICNCFSDEINWEPDHIIPFSKGGKTDVVNGQALCLSCNRKNGAKTDDQI